MAQYQIRKFSNPRQPSLQTSEISFNEAGRVPEDNYPTTSRFEYSPIRSETKEINLLKFLLPSLDTFPTAAECLVFELHRVSLTDAPPYVALSYHWGDLTPAHRVLCHGRLQPVNKNLAQALYTVVCYFREASIRRCGWANISDVGYAYIWAGAICINQQDIYEKALQIPMMGDIYSRASTVFGYVGRPRSREPWMAVLGMISLAGAHDLSSVLGPLPNSEVFPEAPEGVAQDISEFCSSPWFSRSWVTQEVLLAPHVLCVYGLGPTHAHCNFNLLVALVDRAGSMEHYRSDFARFILRNGPDMTIDQLQSWGAIKHKMLTRGQGLDLLTVLEHTHGAGATDPRDKVFSIIGLLDDRSRSAIRMDYSEHTSAQQIYTEVAKHCIVTGDSIRLLDHAGVTTNLPDIPTWVPDWSRKSRTALDSTLYKAAGSTSTTLCLLECGSKISVRGIIFDFVTNVSLAYPEGTPDDISTMFSASTIVNLDDFARRLYGRNEPMRTRYPTQESLDDAILKTITADTSWANRRCKTEDRRYYQAFQAKYGLGGRGPTTSPSDSSNINAHFNISQVPDVSAGEHENSGGSEQLQRGDSPNESNRESLCEEFLIVICS